MAIALFPKVYRTDGTSSSTIQFDDWFTSAQQTTGDYIMIVASNDIGTTALSIDGSFNTLGGVAAPSNSGTRCGVFWKKNTGTLIVAPTITGTNAPWAACAFVIRDAPDVADETWIDTFTRTDFTTNTQVPFCPSVTTSVGDCNIIKINSGDSAGHTMPINSLFRGTLIAHEADNSTVASPSLTYSILTQLQKTAGATTQENYERALTDGGTSYTIAIKNKVGGALPYRVVPTGAIVKTDNMILVTPAIISAHTLIATINGITVLTPTALTQSIVQQSTSINIFGPYRNINTTPPSSVGIFGPLIPVVGDFSNGKLAVITSISTAGTSIASSGTVWVFMDSLNNWRAYNLQSKTVGATFKTIIVNLATETHIGQSVTPPVLSDIIYIGGLSNNVNASVATKTLAIRSIYSIDTSLPALEITGGSSANPITPLAIAKALDSGAIYSFIGVQGGVQELIQCPVQIGDGATESYFSGEGYSLVYPLVGGVETYRVPETFQTVKIKTSATDVIDMSSMTIATETVNNFVIDAASNTAATYTAPSVIRGFNYTPKIGLPTVGSTFTRCPKIIGINGRFESCTFKRTAATDAALRQSDGGKAISCTFIKNGETYAIELLDAGSYDLTDSTFTGYTNDLNFLAASGVVTITLALGQTQPTYVTAGATVVWDQAVASTSYTNTAVEDGTSILARNITANTTIEYVASLATGTGYYINLVPGVDYTVGDAIEIRMIKHDVLTYTKEYTYEITTSGSGGDLISTRIAPPCDVCNALGLDGSAYTSLYAADYAGDEVDIQTATNFTMTTFMSWWSYNMTTEAAMVQFWGAIVFDDSANVQNINSIVRVRFDNLTTTNIYQTDNIRFYATDGGRPVKDASTGGGGIDLVWKNQIYIAEVGTSGLTAGESLTLAKIDTLTEDVSGLRFTTKALETAPSGGSAPSAATIATAVRSELTTELARVDVAVSTRNATAPDNASITAIKAKTDNLPSDPASNTQVNTRLATASYVAAPTVTAIRTEIDTNSTKLDVAVSTRNSVAPDNASITSILADTNELQTNQGAWATATGFATPTNVTDAQAAIIAEVNANEAKLDIIDTNVDAVKAKTDILVNTDLSAIATSVEIAAVKQNTDLIPALV
jgi:hypothetical protein